MAKNGFCAFDSDMHVFEPADLNPERQTSGKSGSVSSARRAEPVPVFENSHHAGETDKQKRM